MFDENNSFSFASIPKAKTKCKTFESSSPPEFRGDKVNFVDTKTNAKIELEKSRVSGFKRSERESKEVYKINVCGR